jgi:2'-5' RNA ligase
MDKIRAFIAIELPPHVKTVLRKLQIDLGAAKDHSVKWVYPDSIHLTLKFLGNVDIETMPQIANAMEKSIEDVKPFSLTLSELGAFPNARSPRVVWADLKGDIKILSGLQKHLEQSLAAIGFPPENKPFSPHLTLGRVRNGIRPNQRHALAERLSNAKLKTRPELYVASIALMKSELTPQGAVYTQLAFISL